MSAIDHSHSRTKIAITGATSGIGLSLTKLLATEELFLAGRNFIEAKKLPFKTPPVFCDADLSTEEGIESMRMSMEKFSPDIVIYCAGFTEYQFFNRRNITSLDQEKRCLFDGAYHLMWSFINQRKAQSKTGTFLVVSSVLAYLPSPAMAMYGATKAAVTSLAASLDAENKKDGIRVLSCAPGPVHTAFQQRASKGLYSNKDYWAVTPDEVANIITKQINTKKATTHPGLMGLFGYLGGKLLPWWLFTALLVKRVQKRIAN